MVGGGANRDDIVTPGYSDHTPGKKEPLNLNSDISTLKKNRIDSGEQSAEPG